MSDSANLLLYFIIIKWMFVFQQFKIGFQYRHFIGGHMMEK
jgi:hypothetical protein